MAQMIKFLLLIFLLIEIIVAYFNIHFHQDIDRFHFVYASNMLVLSNRMSGTFYLLVVQKKQLIYLTLLQSGYQKSLGMKYSLLLFYPTMQICQLNFITIWKLSKLYLTVQNLTGKYKMFFFLKRPVIAYRYFKKK